MIKAIRKLIARDMQHKSLIVQAAQWDDSTILRVAASLDDAHKSTAQGDRLRAYVTARRRHFAPF